MKHQNQLERREQDAIAQRQAQLVVEHFIKALSDESVVNKVASVWSGELDKVIGRGIRRVAWWVVTLILAVGAMKLGDPIMFLKKFLGG